MTRCCVEEKSHRQGEGERMDQLLPLIWEKWELHQSVLKGPVGNDKPWAVMMTGPQTLLAD